MRKGHNPLKSDLTLWPTFGRLFDETASVAPIISCKANDITSLENSLFWLYFALFNAFTFFDDSEVILDEEYVSALYKTIAGQ